MSDKVRLYQDGSEQSKIVEEELKKHHVPYVTRWDPDVERPRPAIKYGRRLLEGMAEIKFYFLRPLERGRRLERLKGI
jgi:hypothetical protein